MSKLDLLKFFESYDGEVEIVDFTPLELEEFLKKNKDIPKNLSIEEFKRRYYEYYDDVKDKSLKKQDW